MGKFVTRAYNSFSVDDSLASVTKRSAENRLEDEIDFYRCLPADIAIYFPRLVDYKKTEGDYSMSLEYYAYDNLGSKMTSEMFDRKFWENAFEFIFMFLKKCQTHTPERPNFSSSRTILDSRDMFLTKTEREHAALLNDERFQKLVSYEDIWLNGRKLKQFAEIWPKIKEYIARHYLDQDFTLVHGDCCFSNILYGQNPITLDVILKFIDPRGSFGTIKCYGDFYYELAKLSHSCSGGYEYFIQDKFTLATAENHVILHYKAGCKYEIEELFNSYVRSRNYDYQKMKTIEGTIFIGMCARHYDGPDRQIAMYMTGLSILNDIYEEILL